MKYFIEFTHAIGSILIYMSLVGTTFVLAGWLAAKFFMFVGMSMFFIQALVTVLACIFAAFSIQFIAFLYSSAIEEKQFVKTMLELIELLDTMDVSGQYSEGYTDAFTELKRYLKVRGY